MDSPPVRAQGTFSPLSGKRGGDAEKANQTVLSPSNRFDDMKMS